MGTIFSSSRGGKEPLLQDLSGSAPEIIVESSEPVSEPTKLPMKTNLEVVTKINIYKKTKIGYHAGCPDGCASAFILKKALEILNPQMQILLIPIGHGSKAFSDISESDINLIASDISPVLEDAEALLLPFSVTVIDHHVSEAETLTGLCKLVPGIVNLSKYHDNHCATSLVAALVSDVYTLPREEILHFVWKSDVFAHYLPEHLTKKYDYYRAFIIQNGERNVTLDLIEAVFANLEEALAKGSELFDIILERTRAQVNQAVLHIDRPNFCLYIVDQLATTGPLDFTTYQEEIDALKTDTPTLFLTRTFTPLTTGLFNLGMRRAGEKVDIAKMGAYLKNCYPFVSGGGHPYAGGMQSERVVDLQTITTLMDQAFKATHEEEIEC